VNGESYVQMVRQTGCHAVMIGRGAIGNPWIFREIAASEQGGSYPPPDFLEMCAVTIQHIRSETARKGEKTGCLQVRKHIARCFRNRPGAAALRKRLYEHTTSHAMIALLEEAAATYQAVIQVGQGPIDGRSVEQGDLHLVEEAG